MSVASVVREVAPWGDPVADDGWHEILAVRSWDDLDADEFIRVYPRLLGGAPASALLANLAECVAVLAARFLSPQERVGLGTGEAALLWRARVAQHRWFPPRASPVFWRPSTLSSGRRGCAAAKRLHRLLAGLSDGRSIEFEIGLAADVAFWGAVHPVYLWPEALPSHQLFTTLGWLGFYARGRGVFMPKDVAEYLVDTIRPDEFDGVFRIADPLFGDYLSDRHIGRLLSSAKQRIEGQSRLLRSALPYALARPHSSLAVA